VYPFSALCTDYPLTKCSRIVDDIPNQLNQLLSKLGKQTGWSFFVLGGGRNPERVSTSVVQYVVPVAQQALPMLTLFRLSLSHGKTSGPAPVDFRGFAGVDFHDKLVETFNQFIQHICDTKGMNMAFEFDLCYYLAHQSSRLQSTHCGIRRACY
jgi:hypothetical protein